MVSQSGAEMAVGPRHTSIGCTVPSVLRFSQNRKRKIVGVVKLEFLIRIEVLSLLYFFLSFVKL